MSRSFKHTPGWCDRNPWAKKEANSRVRKFKDVPNGMAYKKLFESWDIHDYKSLIFTNKDKEWILQPLYKARMK